MQKSAEVKMTNVLIGFSFSISPLINQDYPLIAGISPLSTMLFTIRPLPPEFRPVCRRGDQGKR